MLTSSHLTSQLQDRRCMEKDVRETWLASLLYMEPWKPYMDWLWEMSDK